MLGVWDTVCGVGGPCGAVRACHVVQVVVPFFMQPCHHTLLACISETSLYMLLQASLAPRALELLKRLIHTLLTAS